MSHFTLHIGCGIIFEFAMLILYMYQPASPKNFTSQLLYTST